MFTDSSLLPKPDKLQPAALSGFEHIKRYWDRQRKVYAAKILPGEFYVSVSGEMIVTVLGSCISTCIRDTENAIGGMNHFMLPTDSLSGEVRDKHFSGVTRYGNWAMEYLIDKIIANGGNRESLEIKIFGGAQVISEMKQLEVGKKNIEFIYEYIRDEGLQIAAQDVSGLYPRKVLYFSDTGAVKVKRLRDLSNDTLYKRELSYAQDIKQKLMAGSIDIFD